MVLTPCTGIAHTPTLTKWGAYLEQWAQFSASSLSGQLHSLLVQFQAELLAEAAKMGDVPSTYVEGEAPIPEDAWYTDVSCHGQPPTWAAVVLQPSTETFWSETGAGQSSQWAEFHAAWVVLMNETGAVHVSLTAGPCIEV